MNEKGKAACAVLLMAAACFCAVLRLPAFSAQQSALAAAKFILPTGAMQTQQSSTASSAVSSAAAPPSAAASRAASSQASSAAQSTISLPSGRLTTQKLPGKELGGGIYETDLSDSGESACGIHYKNANQNHKLDVASVLKERPPLKIKTDGTPMVLIYHTHTTEAYAGVTRTRDASKSVVAVGEALAKSLRAAGIGAVHDTTIHDDPAFNGSYTRSAETMRKNLSKYPSIQVTIDVHRDTMTSQSGTRYKPTVLVNGRRACQIMIISGCDDNGTLDFPGWEQNLRLAVRLQKSAADLCPHLMRPLSFGPTRYNEQITPGSLLAEFGTEVNSLDEATYSGALFGKVLAQQLKTLAG
ncbi:MAG: stage II sporulation protein P [Oscillospiraceae bacterium]|nr:stage II sporulation protein P [Oscillospiraceae bacterium]